MPDSKNTDKSKAGFFFHVKGEREADGDFGSYECKGSKGSALFRRSGYPATVGNEKRDAVTPIYHPR